MNKKINETKENASRLKASRKHSLQNYDIFLERQVVRFRIIA